MAGRRAARRLKLPLVYEIRAFWEDAAVGNGEGREGSWKYNLTRALETRAVNKADAVAVYAPVYARIPTKLGPVTVSATRFGG